MQCHSWCPDWCATASLASYNGPRWVVGASSCWFNSLTESFIHIMFKELEGLSAVRIPRKLLVERQFSFVTFVFRHPARVHAYCHSTWWGDEVLLLSPEAVAVFVMLLL